MTAPHFLDPNPKGKQAVLLLHGLGATSSSWSLQFTPLAEVGYRPLAPDAPGFGDSPYDGKGWSARRVAGQMAEMLNEAGTGAVHVVGLSMGGIIAQQFARDFPQLTKKLVLVSTYTMLRPDSFSGWFYFMRRAIAILLFGLKAQAKVVAERVFPAPEQEPLRDLLVAIIASADKRAYRAAMLSLGSFDSRGWLKEITAPTLVVTGARDTTVSPRLQEKLVNGIPGARQVILEGAGHAVPIDRAEEFNRILLDFLR